ncbi:Mu transposase domain-containing protein [Candidatus Skiveiella danica]|uniref:Mu transposase domain-containing protein n=1 Tax=Candidatus Skiveiella danica TaxID=3386177 RepID=UPI0039B9BB26
MQKRFELCDWRYQVRVGNDHHVEHLRCFYSVPSQLAGERVDLRITASMVEVFRGGRRVALHALLTEPGNSTTLPEHRPVAHQRFWKASPRR